MSPRQQPRDEIPVRPLDEENGRDDSEGRGSEHGGEDAQEPEEQEQPDEDGSHEIERQFDDDEQLESGNREPKKLQDPKLPSQDEIRAHELTHLPYRSWCVHCVRGKGKSMAHAKREGDFERREVHMDYCFMGGRDDKKARCILIVKDRESRMIMSSVAPVKGTRDDFVAKRVRAFIRELGLEHVKLTLKGDQEPAIQDLMNEVARIRRPAATMIEEAPVGESQSNGVIERGVQTAEGQIRVLKDALESRIESKIPAEHSVIAWLVEFAGVLVNRYEVGHDGKTSYERLHGKASKLLGLEFGELLNFRRTRRPVQDGGKKRNKLAKLDSLWSDGVFLGYRTSSGEVIVGIDKGVFRTRTVSRKPAEHRWNATNLDMVGGTPWAPSLEDAAGDETMPAVEIPMEIENPEIARPPVVDEDVVPRRLYIKTRDVEKHGYTAGCKGCVAMLRGGRGVPHSEACRKRLTEMIAQSDEGRARKEAADRRRDDYLARTVEKSDKKRKLADPRSGDQEVAGSGEQEVREARAKREREADDQEESNGSAKRRSVTDEEVEEEDGEDEDMEAGAVDRWEYMQVACEGEDFDSEGWYEKFEGEPWKTYVDSRTGELLDPKQVQAAREEEIKELERRVYVVADVGECWDKTGKAPIAVRWVDVHKGGGVHRSRLVAKDFKPKSKVGDIEGLFAATPPLELVKLLFAHAAAGAAKGGPRKVMLIDVSKAHLYAPIDGDVFVDLPPERKVHGKCARLLYTLYGMRTAASGWEREYSGTLVEEGFVVGRANAVTFYHPERDVRTMVHGDDFFIEGQENDLKWVENVLRAKYPLKMRGILGPEKHDAKEVSVLNRVIRWERDGITVEADPKHVEKMLDDMDMTGCNESAVPGVKDKPMEGDETLLSVDDAKAFRSVVARANYLAQDRPDIRFACKELCREMSKPSVGAQRALKKLCRYLKGHPAIVQLVPFGREQSRTLDVYVDSDWAGCATTRKSTNGGAIVWNGACLKTWSTTQTVIALSSGEAEYYAAVKGCAEALAMQSYSRDLAIEVSVRVHTDSSACKGICGRSGLGKIKHLDVQLLWLQDAVRRDRVEMVKIRGERT